MFLRFFRESINFKDLKPIIGIIVFILIIIPWFILIKSGNNTDVLLSAIQKDMVLKLISVQESHGAPPGSYLLSSILTAWPNSFVYISYSIMVF